jgi:hypothetical protein
MNMICTINRADLIVSTSLARWGGAALDHDHLHFQIELFECDCQPLTAYLGMHDRNCQQAELRELGDHVRNHRAA